MKRKNMSRKAILKGQDLRVSKELMKDFTLEDVHEYRINRHAFTLFVGGDPLAHTDTDNNESGVEFRMADRFEMNLNLLSSINPQRPILIMMSSCGGYWDEGMQMFSAILTCPNPVTVLSTKYSRSMSSIIPLAADRFLMRPPAKYMIHRGSCGFAGTELECDSMDVERRKDNEMMIRIYIARLREQGAHKRSSEQRIREMLMRRFEKQSDVWMSASEAVHTGFADAVWNGNQKAFRALKIDAERRQRMLDVLVKPINVTIGVS